MDGIQEELRRSFQQNSIKYAPKQEGARSRKDEDIIELDKIAQYLASTDRQFLLEAVDNKSQLFDQPYQKIFVKGIKASRVYLAWLVGNKSDQERQKYVDQLKDDANASLLGVASTYWIIFCAYQLLDKFTDINSTQINVEKMKTLEFDGTIRKYVSKSVSMFYDAAVDTYDREEYGSYKSTLRSAKFFGKIESKIKMRIARLDKGALPDLVAVCKSLKSSAITPVSKKKT